MKFSTVAAAVGLAATANAHAIMQRVSVNGADQGLLTGLRAPQSNNPLYDVSSQDMICDIPGSTSSTVISATAGAKIGLYWQHIIGGPQGSNDADNPIAASHKGPIQVYLAKVDNAATASKTGLTWFKVASEGFNTGTRKWGVDTMLSGNGWWYFTMPSCIAPGQYLARSELIGLHNAYDNKGAQFYVSCIQLNISGGSGTVQGTSVSFPGSYSQTDPGIMLNIYGSSGGPDNNGRAYTPPGPAVISCGAGSAPQPTTAAPTTMRTTTRATTAAPTAVTTTSKAATTTAPPSGGAGAALYAQCGGIGFNGPTTCSQGTCKASGPYYSQCLP